MATRILFPFSPFFPLFGSAGPRLTRPNSPVGFYASRFFATPIAMASSTTATPAK